MMSDSEDDEDDEEDDEEEEDEEEEKEEEVAQTQAQLTSRSEQLSGEQHSSEIVLSSEEALTDQPQAPSASADEDTEDQVRKPRSEATVKSIYCIFA